AERWGVEHRQHAGIGGVVILHGARVARHELVARFSIGERNLAGRRRGAQHGGRENDSRCRPHSTVILTDSVAVKPLSPVHSKLSVPLSVATVEKVRNGLAAMAGNSSARKISCPLYLQMKSVMMSRGTGLPLLSGGKPVSYFARSPVVSRLFRPG